MEVSRIERQGDDLVMHGKTMGTMPTMAHVRPEEAWAILRMLTWGVVIYLPLFLFRGWQRSKKRKG